MNKACDACVGLATDSRRRALRFEPIGRGDAFEARLLLDDGSMGDVVLDVTAFRTCFINGQPFHVARDVARGVHLLPIADTLPGRHPGDTTSSTATAAVAPMSAPTA